ncbi:hybrid sensor histidine kinase/response regulator [Actinacidiphila bryophytorum]|uniref:hybrid sensor histidine kinase/response regulator n=1 Tax=Actinacidiphila bryophytorum TaxID=1436133 RepID=UPI0019815FE2|nr:PAS domain-containing protein [Actinacidiphila bryophytorum]MBN6547204.1 PAS domain-containing protein [Actinacidiphila bryophytorum]
MSSRPSRGAARLASILDALPDALLLVDVNGTVVNANAIALETFESPGTALVGRGLLDLLPSFDSKRIPGSMRSPREAAEDTRTKPTRMVARRTDGTDFPVEVTSANLENGRTPYADYGDGVPHYTGDELLMLVVRDLTGTMDTEAELARQQRQTEMILRAAAEGVVGVDTAGKVVLVNPSAAQILGYRATDLGGKELHPLVHHSRPDGSALAYEETPLADTLRSGRKHRVRGQVLWRKDGRPVPVDLTTAPVRDGDQLVGAVMTFTDRTAYDALAARSGQLSALLDTSLRGPLAELRGELTGLAADPAGQLWPEANQILHHLAAGYARITTLIDNVLAFQRLDRGEDKLRREDVGLDQVIAAAVEGATELIGPGRAQFAVHAPPIQAAVDGERMAQALAHLVADVAGIDSAGNAIAYTGDSTIVVAAALRGDVIRIDVRGPHAGGDPVHLPLARGIVERHGGVLQTHEVPGQGSAYVLEVPAGKGNGGVPQQAAAAQSDGGTRTAARSAAAGDGDQPRESDTTVMPLPSEPARGTQGQVPAAEAGQAPQDGAPTGRRRALRRPEGRPAPVEAAPAPVQPTGRRRAARTEEAQGQPQELDPAPDRAELPAAPIPNALPPATPDATPETGRRAARRAVEPPAAPGPPQPQPAPQSRPAAGLPAPPTPQAWPNASAQTAPAAQPQLPQQNQQKPQSAPEPPAATDGGTPRNALPPATNWPAAQGTRPAPAAPPPPPPPAPAVPQPGPVASAPPAPPQHDQSHSTSTYGRAISVRTLGQGVPYGHRPDGSQDPQSQTQAVEAHSPQGLPAQVAAGGSGRRRRLNPDRAAADNEPSSRSLIQQVPSQPHGPGGETQARQHPQADPDSGQLPVNRPSRQDRQSPQDLQEAPPAPEEETALLRPVPPAPAQPQAPGRSYAIGAPAAGADEGPEPLDGPNGAVDVTDVADDRVEEPLDEPRRLLVWPEPDVSTRQALTDRGYRPVIVRSREEVDAQVAEPPAALFVDPLTGPITRTALQALRQAAAAADVPVLVTAGLGQATREAAYGADPAVLLKALAPRDSEQHPPRVLLVEGHEPIAQAFAATLERRGMQVAHAGSEAEAMTKAAQIHPNLVVMDLMLIRRRRQGIVDWLRGHARLNNTPLVVYTSADIDPAELPRLASGETVLFLAERSTSTDVQSRIVDLLGKIGT